MKIKNFSITEPDIIILQDFVIPKVKTKFIGFLDYMQDESKQKFEIKEIENEYSYENYLNYMDNVDKQLDTNIDNYSFSNFSNNISKKETEFIKEKFSQAQNNNGYMWRTVFSFNNEYLKRNGMLENNSLNENLLKDTIRKSMIKMLEKENINNYIFTGDIHYNTDNIHLHVATVELGTPTRKYYSELDNKNKFKEAFFHKDTFSYGKRIINSALTTNKQLLIDVDKNIRQDILKNIKLNNLSKIDKKRINKIIEKLPKNKNLWTYNNKNLFCVKKEIKDFSKDFLNINFPENMKILDEQLDKLEIEYYKHYGNGNNNFKENKLEDLYCRTSNIILKELKKYAEDKEIQLKSVEYRIFKNENDNLKNDKIFNFKQNLNFSLFFKNIFNSINNELEEESIKNLKQFKKYQKENGINNKKWQVSKY